ncbi:MAG: hypothetical protein KGJ05_08830, partial [Alphaproteobacteria bacterium]|nr:hypothetical protein [Alphaproteobacteria bacterium]
TATGTVNTAGGFVASTLDMADADFMAGRLNFSGKGASASVSNAGRISAGSAGVGGIPPMIFPSPPGFPP